MSKRWYVRPGRWAMARRPSAPLSPKGCSPTSRPPRLPDAHRPRTRDPEPDAQGHPNPAIAKQLSLSTKTVGNYVSNIFAKLQLADRA